MSTYYFQVTGRDERVNSSSKWQPHRLVWEMHKDRLILIQLIHRRRKLCVRKAEEGAVNSDSGNEGRIRFPRAELGPGHQQTKAHEQGQTHRKRACPGSNEQFAVS